MSYKEVAPGDIVGVIEILQFAGERCTPAEVFRIEADKICVRILAGERRGELLALQLAAENRTWRRDQPRRHDSHVICINHTI